jgi:hypothetical protein
MSEVNKVLDLAQKNDFIEKLASKLQMQVADIESGLLGTNNVELPELVTKSDHETAIKNIKLNNETEKAAFGRLQYEEGKKVESEKGLRKRKQHYKDQGIETDGVKTDLELIDLVIASKVGEKSKTEQEYQRSIKELNEKHDLEIRKKDSELHESKINQKIWQAIDLIQFEVPAEIKDEKEISNFIKDRRKDLFTLSKAEKSFDLFTDSEGIEHLGIKDATGEFKKDGKTFANIKWSEDVVGWSKSKYFNLKKSTPEGRPEIKTNLKTSYVGMTKPQIVDHINELITEGKIEPNSSDADTIMKTWRKENE